MRSAMASDTMKRLVVDRLSLAWVKTAVTTRLLPTTTRKSWPKPPSLLCNPVELIFPLIPQANSGPVRERVPVFPFTSPTLILVYRLRRPGSLVQAPLTLRRWSLMTSWCLSGCSASPDTCLVTSFDFPPFAKLLQYSLYLPDLIFNTTKLLDLIVQAEQSHRFQIEGWGVVYEWDKVSPLRTLRGFYHYTGQAQIAPSEKQEESTGVFFSLHFTHRLTFLL